MSNPTGQQLDRIEFKLNTILQALGSEGHLPVGKLEQIDDILKLTYKHNGSLFERVTPKGENDE